MRTVTAAVSEHALAPLPFRCDPCPRTRQHRPYERARCALVAAVAAAEGSVGGSAVEGSAVAAATVAAAVADYRVVGGLVGVAEGVCAAGMVARGRFVGAVRSCGARA